MIEVLLAGIVTALATGLGAIPVILMGTRAATLRPLLLGLAAGVMIVASVLGLVAPALDRGSVLQVGLGILAGVAFLLVARILMERRNQTLHRSGAHSTTILVFLVLFVHSLPEGFAIGTAYATDPATIGLFMLLAISIQNIPEGTSVAIPMAAEGASPLRQVTAAILTSAPQPVGAVIAYLLTESIASLLPVSFGFAAGAMLTLSVVELLPQAWAGGRRLAVAGVFGGAVIMTLLDLLLKV